MNKKAGLLVMAAGCMWGCMGLLVRSLNAAGFASMDIAFARTIVSAIVLLIGLLIFDRQALRIRLKDIWCFIGTGGLSIAFFNFCYFKTIAMTSLSVAAVLLYTAPTFVMLMSALLFHEKMTKRKVVALFCAFIGCAFVSGIIGEANALSVTGILFGIGSGIGYAMYSIFGRYALNRGYGSMTISFYTFVFASISAIFFVDVPSVCAPFMQDAGLLVQTILLIMLVTIAPYLCYTKGLSKLEGGVASMLASTEPVVATLLGVIIYKEELGLWSMLGILLVILSIILVNLKSKQH